MDSAADGGHGPVAVSAGVAASGWTETELAVRIRRVAGGALRVDGVLCSAPVWFRWDGATLWQVGSGASPVGEDRIRIRVDVGDGVDLRVRSVAATMVYAARGAGTTWDTSIELGAGSSLDWRPEPVILTGRARHRATTTVQAATDSRLVLDETVVLGRRGERGGHWRTTLDVRVGGQPRVLTSLDSALPGFDGPGGVDGAGVVNQRLVLGDTVQPAGERPLHGQAAMMSPAPGCRLAVAATDDVSSARAAVDHVLPFG